MADLQTVIVTKLVHGGQGLAELPDGKKVFVWNAMPGEKVNVRIIKNKRSYAEAIAEEVIQASEHRIAPSEPNYLATSPWQIMDYAYENQVKREITLDVFKQEGVELLGDVPPTVAPQDPWQYRNKMEYSFWGDDDGLHLALHQRGSHGKQIVAGSKLALPAIDTAAAAILEQLQPLNVRAGDLKTIVIRCDQQGQTVAALFVKRADFHTLSLPNGVKGLRIYYSNPKSPASVMTELLQELGDPGLTDTLLGKPFVYDVDSFFQVSVPTFEAALRSIAQNVDSNNVTDMYAGVGSIGLSVAKQAVTLVELDVATSAMAAVNAAQSELETEVVDTSAELSLDYITGGEPIIVDPPRAGLHPKVVDRLLEAKPPTVIYLSCNPITQARDVARLQAAYSVESAEVFNFFPRTPHIESLLILQRRPS